MTAFLIDTNVVSEMYRPHPNRGVLLWIDSTDENATFLSVLTAGEIRNGIERLTLRDAKQAHGLSVWLESLVASFAERVVDIDLEVADVWGRIGAIRPLPFVDGLLAATALVHDLTLVTRNVSDFEGIDHLAVLNPFSG